MSAPYIPRTGTLPDKVCSYFMRLPDEELLTREIAANYGALPGNVALQLKLAVEAGYLALDGSVYSAGPKLDELVSHLKAMGGSQPAAGDEPTDQAGQDTPRASAGFHAWLDKKGLQSAEGRATKPGKPAAGSPPPDAPKAPRRAPAKPFFMDLSEVVIVSGRPFPTARRPGLDWKKLLDRMAVGDSFDVPAAALPSLRKAVADYKKATGRAITLRPTPAGLFVGRVE